MAGTRGRVGGDTGMAEGLRLLAKEYCGQSEGLRCCSQGGGMVGAACRISELHPVEWRDDGSGCVMSAAVQSRTKLQHDFLPRSAQSARSSPAGFGESAGSFMEEARYSVA